MGSPTELKRPRIVRDGDRVWLEGVRGSSFGECASSVHGANAAVMRALGEPITYDELVGVSALAFRLQVHPEFCPSSPHAQCGWACVKGGLDALPWHISVRRTGHLKAENEDDAAEIGSVRAAVVRSICDGIPVQYGDIEDGVIVGYEAGGERWLCYHPLHEGAARPYVEKGLTWGVGIYTERKDPAPSRRLLAPAALRQAVEMWKAERSGDASRDDRMGRAAWTFWIDALQELDVESASKIRHGNAWIYDSLCSFRRSAAAYLRLVAPEFGGSAGEHLLRAAELYERMATRVLVDAGQCPMSVAPYNNGEFWSDAQRDEQVRRMRAAAELDGRAIAEIERALGAMAV